MRRNCHAYAPRTRLDVGTQRLGRGGARLAQGRRVVQQQHGRAEEARAAVRAQPVRQRGEARQQRVRGGGGSVSAAA
jgi:hypothetical protein